jgi:hypothetical protein
VPGIDVGGLRLLTKNRLIVPGSELSGGDGDGDPHGDDGGIVI